MSDMRNILYKGKIKNWRELPKEQWWVDGYYCKRKSGRYTDIGFEEEYKDCIVKEFSDGGISFCDIDPETVCQYTGSLTADIKKIFVNDIVGVDGIIGVVKFGKYGNGFHLGYYIQWINSEFRQELGFWEGEVKHLGNVFDNPEFSFIC